MIADQEIHRVILAAGKSTRFSSPTNKLLYPLAGKPLIQHLTDACMAFGKGKVILVLGAETIALKELLGEQFIYVFQAERLGTGHALLQAVPELMDFRGHVMVFPGDCPFFSAKEQEKLIKIHLENHAGCTMVTSDFDIPGAFGRIIRDADGRIQAVREAKDASPDELKIQEVNSSIYCFSAPIVLPLLQDIHNNNRQQEYYLTDIIELLVRKGEAVAGMKVEDPMKILGINDLEQLKAAEAYWNDHMKSAG